MTTANEAYLRRMRLQQEDTGPGGRKPPGWLLDKLADEKLTGRYDVRPDNICQIHHLARSRNGSCIECEGT